MLDTPKQPQEPTEEGQANPRCEPKHVDFVVGNGTASELRRVVRSLTRAIHVVRRGAYEFKHGGKSKLKVWRNMVAWFRVDTSRAEKAVILLNDIEVKWVSVQTPEDRVARIDEFLAD